MSVLTLTDGQFFVGTDAANVTEISDFVTRMQISWSAEDQSYHPINSKNKVRVPDTAEEWTVTTVVKNVLAANGTHATLWPLRNTIAWVEFRPTSGAASPTNPYWTGWVHINSLEFVNADGGQQSEQSVTWPGSGDPTLVEA